MSTSIIQLRDPTAPETADERQAAMASAARILGKAKALASLAASVAPAKATLESVTEGAA